MSDKTKAWRVIAIGVVLMQVGGLRLPPTLAQGRDRPAPVAQRVVFYDEDTSDSKASNMTVR